MNNLTRFGIIPGQDAEEQLAAVTKLLGALVANPHLEIGEDASVLKFPAAGAAQPPLTAPSSQDSLPFEVSVTSDTITVAPGVIDIDSHAEESLSSPANGTYYIEAKVVINATTGAITSTDILISSSESANTSTDFFSTLATVVVSGGEPEAPTQTNYGPILALPYGDTGDVWAVLIF